MRKVNRTKKKQFAELATASHGKISTQEKNN